MSYSPLSPKILKGAIVFIDPVHAGITRIIPLQYNPSTVTRTLQVQGAGNKGNRSEALRLTGPPVETYKLDIELDATDQLEREDPTTLENGIQPVLSVLESILYPKSLDFLFNFALSHLGALEILPAEAPLTLFVWGKQRIVPVRITGFTITEQAFDQKLNPIRAKIDLGLRVLSIDDLDFLHPGGVLYMAYQINKERLAAMF